MGLVEGKRRTARILLEKILTGDSPDGFYGNGRRQEAWGERRAGAIAEGGEESIARLFLKEGHVAYNCLLTVFERNELGTILDLVKQKREDIRGLGPVDRGAVRFIQEFFKEG